MDHPPVRSRGAGRQRHQAAGRRPRRRARPTRRWSRRCSARWTGLAIGCGINPRYGDLDPYAMAAAAIDEAVRNVVAVGADPARIAMLDNFCWGNTDRPEVLGSLVRAAEACRDVALAYSMPFISGKDSLNNEFHHRRPQHRHSADAAHQRPGPGARRPPLRDDGPEGAGQSACSWSASPRTNWAARTIHLVHGAERRRGAGGGSRRGRR